MSRARILADYVSSGDELADKAPIDDPTFTGTVAGVTKAHVGLGNVANETRATILATPTLTGVTTAASLVLTPTDNPPASTTGGVYYDTSEKRLKHYDGTEWSAVNKQMNYDRPGDGQYDTDTFTKFLLHSNTTDGSTTFTDSGTEGFTLTANDGITHNTAVSKIGASSITFDGTNNHLTSSSVGTHLNFGTGDFVIDFWYNPLSNTGTNELGLNMVSMHQASSTNINDSAWWMRWYNQTASTAVMQFTGNFNNAQTVHNATGVGVTANTWSHWAFVRSSGTSYMFKNGVLLNTATTLNGYDFDTRADPLSFTVGARGPIGGVYQWLNGQLDEIRISVGTDRGWNTGFLVY